MTEFYVLVGIVIMYVLTLGYILLCDVGVLKNHFLSKRNKRLTEELDIAEALCRHQKGIINDRESIIDNLSRENYDLRQQIELYRIRESIAARNRAKPKKSTRKGSSSSTGNEVKGKSNKKA